MLFYFSLKSCFTSKSLQRFPTQQGSPLCLRGTSHKEYLHVWCNPETSLTSEIAPNTSITTLHVPFLHKEGACKAELGAKGMILLEVFMLGMALSMGEGKGLYMIVQGRVKNVI